MSALPNIADALGHPGLFKPWFPGASWDPWRAVLRAAFGLPMSVAEVEFFRSVAERDPPPRRVRELWAVVGRRGGKDSLASVIAAHAASGFNPVGANIRPGERPLVMCLAVDREQASIVLSYTRSFFAEIPPLRDMVVRQTSAGFELNNGVDIAIVTNDFRAVRGRTILAVIMDEVSFWRQENSASPDREVYRAVRPGMTTLPDAMLIGITTAYRRAGLVYSKWSKHYGHNDDAVLVIRATSRQMNPTLPQSEIDEALLDDPEAARAEYLSEWRDDLATFVVRELVEAAVDRGVTVRPPLTGVKYTSWIDASSGMGDSFAAAVAHQEGDVAVLDCLVEVPSPFDAAAACAQVAAVLKSYGQRDTSGDDYAKGFVIAELARHGISFTPRPAEMNRSVLYLEMLPRFSSGRACLLDHPKAVAQFCALERRAMPGGRDRVDHPHRGHDDLSNVIAGVFWRLGTERPSLIVTDEVLARVRALRPRDRGCQRGGSTQAFFGPGFQSGSISYSDRAASRSRNE